MEATYKETLMIPRLKKLIQRCDDEGQGLVEYGLILGLIAVVAIAALNATGTQVNGLLQKVAASLGTIS
jgi:pilus assembly protein Flp/PilA